MNQLIPETGAMRLRLLESNIIYAVGYAKSSETLVIISRQGKVYQYFQVPQAVYEELLAIDAVDQYLQQSIINCYPWIQVKRRGRKRHR